MNFGREHFDDLPSIWLHLSQKELKSPEDVLNDLGSNIGNDFSIQLDKPELLELSLTDFLQKILRKMRKLLKD